MYSCNDTPKGGLPHSDIHGSKPARGSPWLFAACHVLHRLLVPRPPPNALLILRSSTHSLGNNVHHARKPSSDFSRILHPSFPTPLPADLLLTRHRILSSGVSLTGNPFDRIHTHASEPSLPEPGALLQRFNPPYSFPGQTSLNAAGRRRTRVRFHRTRPETHQNLIHTDKEQNRHR